MEETLTLEAQLSRYRTLDTGNREESLAILHREICPHVLVPVRDAPLHTLHSRVSLSSCSLHYVRYGAPVQILNAYLPDRYLVLVPCGGESIVRVGCAEFSVKNRDGVIIFPGSRFEVEGDSAAALFVARIKAEAMNAASEQWFSGRPLDEHPLARPFQLEESVGGGFVRTLRFVLRELDHVDGLAVRPALRDRLEELLISSLLGTSSLGNHTGNGCMVVPGCVRRVEEYITEHVSEEIKIATLVEISCVSARTLFRSFRNFRGRTPMTYLRLLRLQQVRADLLGASEGDTVTSILTRRGVTQFGRFAAQYRRFYGELPSTSLRLAQEHARE